MKHLLMVATVLSLLAVSGRECAAQAGAAGPQPEAKVPSPTPVTARTDKQLALQAQTDRLVALATELKEQVDKTNKNILSVKVVRKAEEIEQFAKRLKEQGKK